MTLGAARVGSVAPRFSVGGGPSVAAPAKAWALSIQSRAASPVTTSVGVVDVAALGDDEAEVLRRADHRLGGVVGAVASTCRPDGARQLDTDRRRRHVEPAVDVGPAAGDEAELGDVLQPVGRLSRRRRPRRRCPGRAPTPPSAGP